MTQAIAEFHYVNYSTGKPTVGEVDISAGRFKLDNTDTPFRLSPTARIYHDMSNDGDVIVKGMQDIQGRTIKDIHIPMGSEPVELLIGDEFVVVKHEK